MEIFKQDGVSFHAYPKGDGKNESARHGPHGEYHFHVNGDKNKVVNAYTFEPENPSALTKKEKKVLENLSENEKRYVKKACREVFHNNPSAIPRLRMRYLSILGGMFGPLMSNSYEETCNIDVNNSTGVCP